MARHVALPWPAAVGALMLSVLLIWPAAGAASAPVAMAPQLEDDLAQVERDWNVTTVIPPYRMDVLGTPREGTVEVAYRFHNDIAAFEGTITRPRPSTGQPHAIYNTGMRIDAVQLTPALESDDGRLEHIYPGALQWSALERVPAEDEVQRFAAWAAVPAPDEDGGSPPTNDTRPMENEDGAPLAWMLWSVAVRNTTGDDPLLGAASPANVHFTYHLFLDASLSAAPQDQNATTTLQFDFGGEAEGRAVTGPDPLQAEGIHLNRSHVYAMLRLVDTVHAATQTGSDPEGERTAIAVHYQSVPGFATPVHEETRTLISPIALNVTHGMLRGDDGAGSLVGSPDTAGRDIVGYRLDGAFGYQRHDVGGAPATTETSPDDADREVPAPALVVPLLGLGLVVFGLRRAHGGRGPA